LIILRWPAGGVSETNFIDALTARVIKDDISLDLIIGGDLLIPDAPVSNRKTSIELLEEAFKGEPGLLRKFVLYDYKEGRFVKVKRKWKKKKLSFH
jgi:hypothetical protein